MTEQEKKLLGLPWELESHTLKSKGVIVASFMMPVNKELDFSLSAIEARAAYTFNAVNSYEALVEACEAALNELWRERQIDEGDHVRQKLRIALARARGEGK